MPSFPSRPSPVLPTILSGPLYLAVNIRRRAGFILPAVALLAGVALLGGGHSARAATKTWQTAAGGDWDTAGNWNGGVPGTGDLALFNIAMTGNVTLASASVMNSINFDTSASTFSIGTIGGNTLSGSTGGNISVLATLAGTNKTFTINAPLILAPASAMTAGAYTIQNNATSATNTLVIAGGISAGTTSNTETLTLAGSNTGTNLISGAITNGGATTFALAKSGAGTWTLTGTNTYNGGTSVTAGTLALDFSGAGAPTTNIISSSSALTLGGGTLSINGKSSGTNTQAFASTSFSGNTSSILSFTQNGATSLGATLGGLTRVAGSTVDVTLPTTGTVSTTTTSSNGTNKLNGASVAYSTANGGTTWLVNTSGVLSALGAGSYQTNLFAASGDTDITASDAPTAFTVNTLRFNTGSKTLTLNSSGVSTVTAGGILVTSAGTGSVIASGGTGAGLTAGATGKEIVVHDYADLNISAPITNNGANAVALTLAGTGTTTLSGANTYTGATSINEGTVILGSSQVGTTSGAFGTGGSALTVASGATLNLNGNNVSVGAMAFNTGSGTTTLASTAAGALTVGSGNGAVNLSGLSTITGAASLTINGSGTFTASPTFTSTSTGSITIQNGNGNAASPNVRLNNLATNLGSSMSLVFNGSAAFQTTGSVTLGTGNGIVVNGSANIWNYQLSATTAVTTNGAWTGSGRLELNQGYNAGFVSNGDMSAFAGTIDVQNGGTTSNNSTSLSLGSGAATTGSSLAAFTQSALSTGNTGTNIIQYSGTGSRTVYLGDLSTSGAPAGSFSAGTTSLQDATPSTTATFQVGALGLTSTYAGTIVNGAGTTAITKVGTGIWTLTGTNTYTGATLISGGTLNLAATKTISASAISTTGITVASTGTLSLTAASALNTPGATTSTTADSPVSVAGQVPITLSGGTLLRNGTGVSLGTQSGTAGTVGIGMLTLTANSTIDYGTTGVGTLNFNGLSGNGTGGALTSTSKLTIVNFTTTHPSAAGTDGTDDRFIVNEDLTNVSGTNDLPFITIDGIVPTEIALGNGEFELSVTPVPEPSTWVAGLLGLGALGLRMRRRLAGAFKRQSAL